MKVGWKGSFLSVILFFKFSKKWSVRELKERDEKKNILKLQELHYKNFKKLLDTKLLNTNDDVKLLKKEIKNKILKFDILEQESRIHQW